MFGGAWSIQHWLIVLLIVMLLFGSGKISGLMGEFAKGIKSFKKNMADDGDVSAEATAEKPAGTISPPGTVHTSTVGSTTGAARPG